MNNIKNNEIKENFTIIPNEFISDSEISAMSKAIFLIMAMMPQDWKFYNTDLMKRSGIKNRHTLKKYMDELVLRGWIIREGKNFEANSYTINQQRIEVPEEVKTAIIEDLHGGQKIASDKTSQKSNNLKFVKPWAANSCTAKKPPTYKQEINKKEREEAPRSSPLSLFTLHFKKLKKLNPGLKKPRDETLDLNKLYSPWIEAGFTDQKFSELLEWIYDNPHWRKVISSASALLKFSDKLIHEFNSRKIIKATDPIFCKNCGIQLTGQYIIYDRNHFCDTVCRDEYGEKTIKELRDKYGDNDQKTG